MKWPLRLLTCLGLCFVPLMSKGQMNLAKADRSSIIFARLHVVPRHRLSTYGRRAFAVAGPTVWNSLPEDMRDPDVSEDSYRQSLKTFLFSQY